MRQFLQCRVAPPSPAARTLTTLAFGGAERGIRSPASAPVPVDPPRRTLHIPLPAREGGGTAALVYTLEAGGGRAAGAPVVCALHGAPGSTFDWRYLSTPLAAAAPDARLLRIEVPGFGGSSARLSPRGSPAGADLARALARRALPAVCEAEGLRLPSPAHAPGRAPWVLCGHSIGCEAAQLLAAELLDLRGGGRAGAGAGLALALVNPLGLRPHRGMRPMWAVRLAAALLDLPAPLGKQWQQTLRSLWVNVFRFPARVKTEDVAWGQRRAAAIDWPGLRANAALLRAAGVRTAVLYSANDHLVEKAVSRELCAALAAGDVSVSSDAGHWANKLQAEEVAAMVARVIAA